jgi:hypothetical protein
MEFRKERPGSNTSENRHTLSNFRGRVRHIGHSKANKMLSHTKTRTLWRKGSIMTQVLAMRRVAEKPTA